MEQIRAPILTPVCNLVENRFDWSGGVFKRNSFQQISHISTCYALHLAVLNLEVQITPVNYGFIDKFITQVPHKSCITAVKVTTIELLTGYPPKLAIIAVQHFNTHFQFTVKWTFLAVVIAVFFFA